MSLIKHLDPGLPVYVRLGPTRRSALQQWVALFRDSISDILNFLVALYIVKAP